MRHRLLLIALALTGVTFAQSGNTLKTGDANVNTEYRGGISASRVMQVPNDSLAHTLPGIPIERRIRFNPATKQFEGGIGSTWNQFATTEYTKTISVGVGGTYLDLENLFAFEPAGKTLILLTDATYNCANPKFVFKDGWTIRGQGIGKTKIIQTFSTTIDPDTSGLHIRQSCKLEDIEVITINNVVSGGLGQYALHADYSTYSNFKAEINRCSFRTVLSAQSADLNGFNGLTVGIGSWEGQTIVFNDCFLEGAYVTYSDKHTLNLHNKYTAAVHVTPSRIRYDNCIMTGGFTTVLISDVYSNDAEPNQGRVQDLFEFINCDMSNLWLRSHSQLGTVPKKNGIVYNFTGTKVREFLNTAEVVDTSLSNYTVKSLPVTEDVEYLKNIGATTINAGDFVSYVYGNRLPEYHLTAEKTINTVIGVEKLTAANINNFAGIALATSAAGNFNHFAKGAIAYTSLTSTSLNVGDNVTFDVDGNLIRAWFGGIGVVRKKTYNNRLGIELTPTGIKTNAVGDNTHRGVLEIKAEVGTTWPPIGGKGSPSLRLIDLTGSGYGWQMSIGTNSNSAPIEEGRFSINDLNKGIERFGISKDGLGTFTGEEFYLNNQPPGISPYTTLKVGTQLKPALFKLVSAYNSGNSFEIYPQSSGKVSFNFSDVITAFTIDPTTVNTLQVNGGLSTTNDIEITDVNKGVIMTDTVTGTRYRMKITSGALTITALP